MKRMGDARSQSGQRRFERVAGERVGVLAGREAFAERITATPWIAAIRIRNTASRLVPGGKAPASMTRLDAASPSFLHLAHETKPLPVAG